MAFKTSVCQQVLDWRRLISQDHGDKHFGAGWEFCKCPCPFSKFPYMLFVMKESLFSRSAVAGFSNGAKGFKGRTFMEI